MLEKLKIKSPKGFSIPSEYGINTDISKPLKVYENNENIGGNRHSKLSESISNKLK